MRTRDRNEKIKNLLRANDYDLYNNSLFVESINDDEVTFKLVHWSARTNDDVKSTTLSIKELEADAQELIDYAIHEYSEKGAKEILEAWKAYNV